MSRKLALLSGEKVKQPAFPNWPQYDENERQALMELLDSRVRWRMPGKRALQLEKEFAAYYQAEHGIAHTWSGE